MKNERIVRKATMSQGRASKSGSQQQVERSCQLTGEEAEADGNQAARPGAASKGRSENCGTAKIVSHMSVL